VPGVVTHRPGQAGFTLVELLVTMMLSLIVVGAAFALVSGTERASKTVRDRVDASQRGRLAMERITQELRAMACPEPIGGAPPASPIVSASNDQITFLVNLVNRDELSSADPAVQNAAFDAEQRQLTVIRGADGNPASIREDRWVDGPALPPRSRTLVAGIAPLRGPRPDPATPGPPLPVFSYFPYEPDPYAAPAELPAATPLLDDQRRSVAQVRVAFTVRPQEARRDELASVGLQSSVYARTYTNRRGSVSAGSGTATPTDRFFQCQ